MMVKTIDVWPENIPSTSRRLEAEWVRATLISVGISEQVIDKVERDPDLPKSFWRNYLIDNFRLEVLNDRAHQQVTILKSVGDPKKEQVRKIVVGLWKDPQIVRSTEIGKPCKMILQHKP